ncbi:hypothetical protein CLNEO_21870 [Anaerotignum neopropionicum]|uniref:DUF6870 domain-containing protein n=1 Tax=Anaerotignum neopropionicum TaxID=36847 RepID=A0A136WDF3_9FIRM|nr:hypothetical protein [Anaerotignum neopropionicum]KXL52491.1 hypothetical protein CLNEO_21870 [Anaerotignum neopropionicum]
MITLKQLEEMKKVDPFTINPEDLVDIKDVEINIELPKEERIADFIRQIKNPYLFKCGDIVVACEFSPKEPTLTERIKQYLRMIDDDWDNKGEM